MSDCPLPEYVDTRKIFINEGSVSGSIEIGRLIRIKNYLAGEEGNVRAEIQFSVDDAGRRRIGGMLEAQFQVQCQRCLEPLQIMLKDDINLVLVADLEAAKTLDKQFDPWINEDTKISLANLIDEQLVLCMPIVNYHRSGPCSERGNFSTASGSDGEAVDSNDPAKSPFAVLASLKK